MITTIYFIRHAESEFVPNMEMERGLTEKGKEDSLKIIEILKNEQIDLFTYLSNRIKTTNIS